MEQETPDSDAEKKDKGIDAVLYTKKQRKTSKAHEEQLKQEGKNAKQYLCKDISSITSLKIDELSSLHLIVDTCLYGILMSGGRLCEDAFEKFTELDESGKTIYVVNTLSNEFDDLYHQIPSNARELWSQKKRPLQLDENSPNQIKDDGLPNIERLRIAENSVTGVTGGTVTTSNNAGVNNGRMGNKTNDMTIHTSQNFQIFYQATGEEGIQSVTLRKGSESSLPNGLKVTIENAKNEKEMVDKLTSNKGTLENGPVLEAETGIGSVIINLTVDKSHIMTDVWIQDILKKIFYDILRDLITEETKLQVTVERYISIGVHEFLRLYSTYHNHEECVAKIEAMKSQFEALSLQGESSLNISSETLDDGTLNQDPLEEREMDDKLRQEPLEEKEIDDKSKQESLEEKEIDKKILEEKQRQLKQIIKQRSQGVCLSLSEGMDNWCDNTNTKDGKTCHMLSFTDFQNPSSDGRDAESKKTVDDDLFTADIGIVCTESVMRITQRGYKGCSKCESIVANNDQHLTSETRYLVTHVAASVFSSEFLTKQQLKAARSQFYRKLKCFVSALQNSGGGVVLIHIDGLEPTDDYLGFFHEVAYNALSALVEDGSLYVNTFRIEWMKRIFQEDGIDPHYLYTNVVFIGVSPSISVISVTFNTQLRSDNCLSNPNNEQIRRYLKTKKKFPSTVPCVRGLENIQQSRNVVVKSFIFRKEQESLLHDDLRLAEHVWKTLKLECYVFAFSKVEGGGSFYLGVVERKEKLSSYETRKYHIEGFHLKSQRRYGLMAALRRKIETETLVLFFDSEQSSAPLPQEYVEIVFHEVSNRFVLEVAIAAVNGLVFHTKEGPEAYELNEQDELQRLDVQEWRRRLLM